MLAFWVAWLVRLWPATLTGWRWEGRQPGETDASRTFGGAGHLAADRRRLVDAEKRGSVTAAADEEVGRLAEYSAPRVGALAI
jgi:hypothetical protein